VTARPAISRFPKICIIGAGSRGICHGEFRRLRNAVRWLEKSDRVGGNWVFKYNNGMSVRPIARYSSIHRATRWSIRIPEAAQSFRNLTHADYALFRRLRVSSVFATASSSMRASAGTEQDVAACGKSARGPRGSALDALCVPKGIMDPVFQEPRFYRKLQWKTINRTLT